MRERLGINKRSVLAAAQRAFDRGAAYQDTSGKLRHFLDDKIICYGSQSVYRIYSEFLYVFSVDGFLITIVPLYCQMTKCVKSKSIKNRKGIKNDSVREVRMEQDALDVGSSDGTE